MLSAEKSKTLWTAESTDQDEIIVTKESTVNCLSVKNLSTERFVNFCSVIFVLTVFNLNLSWLIQQF